MMEGQKYIFYDMNNKKFMRKKRMKKMLVLIIFYYVDSLKSVMCIDKDSKLYRLKFEENRYYLGGI